MEPETVEVPLAFLFAVKNALEIATPEFQEDTDEHFFDQLGMWLDDVRRWIDVAEGIEPLG
jgi:hypothetical protein